MTEERFHTILTIPQKTDVTMVPIPIVLVDSSLDPSRGLSKLVFVKLYDRSHFLLELLPLLKNYGSLPSSGSAASDDMGDWILKGIHLIKTIPSEQEASDNYAIELVLSLQAT